MRYGSYSSQMSGTESATSGTPKKPRYASGANKAFYVRATLASVPTRRQRYRMSD
jgi:hypothetical protein